MPSSPITRIPLSRYDEVDKSEREHAKPHAPLLTEARARLDGFFNLLTGLGTSRDKAMAADFERAPTTPDVTLENMYRSSDMIARAVEALPEDAMRVGFCVEIEVKDGAEAPDFDAAMDDLGARDKFMDAAIWARVFGGSAIYVGIADGLEAKEPVDEARIASIDFLNVVDRRGLRPASYYSDPLAKNYGKIASYYLTAAGLANMPAAPLDLQPVNVEIHESRLIIFDAIRATPRMRAEAFGFSPSMIERAKGPLAQFEQAWQATTHLILDGSQGVLKIKGLMGMIGANSKLLADRMLALDLSRSVARALVITDGEEYTREEINLAGHAQILQSAAIRLAAALRMPVTILFGQSPTGLNATGEADIKWWYDTVAAYQEHYFKPRLSHLIRLLALSKSGPTSGAEPDSWDVRFFPLSQPTALEEQKRRMDIATRDCAYVAAQVLTPEEVAKARFGSPDGFDREIAIDPDLRQGLIDKALDDLANPPAIDVLDQTAPGAGTKAPPPPERGPSPLVEPNLKGSSA